MQERDKDEIKELFDKSLSLSERLKLELQRLETQTVETTDDILAKKAEKLLGLSSLVLEKIVYSLHATEEIDLKEVSKLILALEKLVSQLARLKKRFSTRPFENIEVESVNISQSPTKLLKDRIQTLAKQLNRLETVLEKADLNSYQTYTLYETYKDLLAEYRKLLTVALQEQREKKAFKLQLEKFELEKQQFEFKRKQVEREFEFAREKLKIQHKQAEELLKKRYEIKLEFEKKAKELEKQVETNAVTAEDLLKALEAYDTVYEKNKDR